MVYMPLWDIKFMLSCQTLNLLYQLKTFEECLLIYFLRKLFFIQLSTCWYDVANILFIFI